VWAELNKKEERERKSKGREGGRETERGRKGRDPKEQKPKQVFVSFLLSFLVLVLILVLVLVPFSPLVRLRMSGHCCIWVDTAAHAWIGRFNLVVPFLLTGYFYKHTLPTHYTRFPSLCLVSPSLLVDGVMTRSHTLDPKKRRASNTS